MRVSNQMMADNIKANLNKQVEQLLKSGERIATGKRINRPSDDPIGMSQVLAYRKTIANMQQYNDNITLGELHINTVEQILDSVSDLLTDAKRIASDPNTELRDAFAEQVGIMRDQLLQLANTQINGNYIFSGDLTATQPFNSAGVYAGDGGSKDVIIGNNLQIGLEADGSRIFQGAGDVFTMLSNLQTALQIDDQVGIANQITPLHDAIEQLKTIRTENAGIHKRMQATANHYASFKVNVEELLSRTEDADMAQAIIDLKVQQTAYESTLAASAKVIQPSLIDFLK